jgi:pimeloyl-[acyl-carrier protein] methyl ester esterase
MNEELKDEHCGHSSFIPHPSSFVFLLLPGMHGSGELFEAFIRATPGDVVPIVIPLPQLSSYDTLLEEVRLHVPRSGSFFILGESFSGPLALRIASEIPGRVSGLILCNSFLAAPRSSLLRFLPWSLIMAIPPPESVIRRFLVGEHASSATVSAVQAAIAGTPSQVLASRMHSVFTLSATQILKSMRVPILCLRGTEDRLVPIGAVETIQRVAPHVQRTDIRAPHLLLQVAANEAWEAVQWFIEQRA